MAAKLVIKQAKDGYRFVLKASNGGIVASSESYSNAAGAESLRERGGQKLVRPLSRVRQRRSHKPKSHLR